MARPKAAAQPEHEEKIRVTYVIPRHLDAKVNIFTEGRNAEGKKTQKSQVIETALKEFFEKKENLAKLEHGINAIKQKVELAEAELAGY